MPIAALTWRQQRRSNLLPKHPPPCLGRAYGNPKERGDVMVRDQPRDHAGHPRCPPDSDGNDQQKSVAGTHAHQSLRDEIFQLQICHSVGVL